MAEHPVTEVEEWREIPGHPGYEASSLGRVRSVDRWITYSNGYRHLHPGVLMQPGRRGKYLRVKLGQAGIMAAHVVICLTFHGQRPTKHHQVAHWNGNYHDNRSANLRWALPKENRADDIINGTRQRGSKCHQATLTERDVVKIRKLRATVGLTFQAIGDKYGMSRSRVWEICHGRSWRHVPRPERIIS